MFSLNSAVHC